MLNVYNEFDNSCMECARYILDSQSEQESYMEFIQDGNDPRDHILYHASIVLGKADEFQDDINEYSNGQVN